MPWKYNLAVEDHSMQPFEIQRLQKETCLSPVDLVLILLLSYGFLAHALQILFATATGEGR
jgi:hypothetical protein